VPTLSPSSDPPPDGALHQQRRIAESFGADADRYDRARPTYPDALVRRVVAASPGPEVLDVGCGTGIVARLFRAAGCTVVGVDPDHRMVDLARDAGLEAEVSSFETWDAAGRRFDAVVSGQAWHWIDPDAGAVRAGEALRPGGRLALFWNVFDPAAAVAEAFAGAYRAVPTGLPFNPWTARHLDASARLLARATDGIVAAGVFGEPEQWRDGWRRTYSRAEWLDQVPTHGGHSHLPPAALDDLMARLGDAIDRLGGSFEMAYVTVTLAATRRSEPGARRPESRGAAAL
jgi:SAM-dependent methyltransferase